MLYKLKWIPKWGNASQQKATHADPRTSPLPHSVFRGRNSIYLFLPFQLKLPPQKAIKIVYLGTTANISCLITNASNLMRGGHEESHHVLTPLSLACSLPYLTLWDMCKGVSISSKIAPFTLDPLKLASCRSQPERSQFWRVKEIEY